MYPWCLCLCTSSAECFLGKLSKAKVFNTEVVNFWPSSGQTQQPYVLMSKILLFSSTAFSLWKISNWTPCKSVPILSERFISDKDKFLKPKKREIVWDKTISFFFFPHTPTYSRFLKRGSRPSFLARLISWFNLTLAWKMPIIFLKFQALLHVYTKQVWPIQAIWKRNIWVLL